MVTVRFFAAARAAVGASTAEAPAGTIDGILSNWTAPELAKCSFLINGVAASGREVTLSDGDTLDVLPPFAGG